MRERLAEVEARIGAACRGAGRERGEVTLLAVTKVFPVSAMVAAYEAGLREFGENYVQEFEGKYPVAGSLAGARFHLIGHLQSNKSRKAGEIFDVVQTVDSGKLARRLDELGRPLEVMIEVKLSPEDSKHGCLPAQLPNVVAEVRACANLTLTGFMTMPPWSDDAELSRPYFRALRKLAAEHRLEKLSMGMSHDLEVAIEEGSTMVRVGTALFGSRKKA
ncbi:MAG TPA: YggS family pyridoxal phosphate-dependent enzyme [Paludibaculum sp.]